MIRSLDHLSVRIWTRIGLLNLLLVAVMGILMRLKFLLPLPFIPLKNLQHAHSHFAFAGWVSHMLILFLVVVTFQLRKKDYLPRQHARILFLNLVCSFGMLVSFLYQGYGIISITCSTCSIFISYMFAGTLWRDMYRQKLDHRIARWFKASLIYLVVSSLGTFYLAYMMATHQLEVKAQLSAIYFYLHFQYNGWFFFAILGLVSHYLSTCSILQRANDRLFYTLSIVTAPLYLLSVLWYNFSTPIYTLIALLAIAQFGIWIYWMIQLHASPIQKQMTDTPRYLKVIFSLISCAVLLKFFLQGLSVIPSLSDYVYGFRPVIIAYLHLVLLVIISIFLIGYSYQKHLLHFNRDSMRYFTLFITGVVANELFLALQASLAMVSTGFPHAHLYLFGASLLIGIGILGMLLPKRRITIKT